jgi:hypothetical protein
MAAAIQSVGLEIEKKERALELNVGFKELVVAKLRGTPLGTALVTPASIATDEDLVPVAIGQKNFSTR